MGINKKYAEKFTKAYEGLEAMHAPIYFFKDSENYHKEEWREIIQKYIPNVMMHCYFVSTYGKVYSSLKSPKYPNGGLLIPSVNEHGYYQLNLQNQYNSKERICVKINRLVLLRGFATGVGTAVLGRSIPAGAREGSPFSIAGSTANGWI